MVRLSLVNMYLHGFTDPHIYEYDTLTSDDRWNEHADVILANPPFMSPKGGIKPHKRFSIQAKRSEVLFVDYMAEHLTPTGRAGIIVPEGIIFQSQTAYKDLRKMLVENSLVAVISLPAGCFNPYSGVKTSILILDKSLARQSGTIAFFKVDNDGFGLGAQRRAFDKNDIPRVKVELHAYLQALRSHQPIVDLQPSFGLIVPKETIAANADYSLNGERYREAGARHSAFPLRPFEEVCTLEYGASLPKEKRLDGPYPVVGSNGITGYHSEYLVEGPVIIVGRKGSAGEVTLIEKNCFPIDTTYFVKQTNPAQSDVRYLYWLLKTLNLPELRGGAGIPGLNRTEVYEKHQIPLPPVEVQKELVAEIEGYQRVINGASAVLEHYRPHIPIHPDWPVFELSEVSTKITDGAHFTPTYVESGVPFLRVTDITESNTSKKFIPQEEHDELIMRCRPEKGDVLYSKNGTIGIAKLVDWDWEFSIFVSLALIKPRKELLDPHYLTCFLNSDTAYAQATARSKSGTVTNLHLVDIKTIKIPVPPLAIQQTIVAELEAEQALVDGNRELITRFEQKVQDTLARLWGEGKPVAVEA